SRDWSSDVCSSDLRDTLQGVEAVIVDEIHALAATKRGSHLALTLERLDHWVRTNGGASPQRIGLSATQRPLEEIARFLGGFESTTHQPRAGSAEQEPTERGGEGGGPGGQRLPPEPPVRGGAAPPPPEQQALQREPKASPRCSGSMATVPSAHDGSRSSTPGCARSSTSRS